MGEARIEFTIGAVSFVGEGEKDWVAAQLDKILEKAPDLVRLAPRRQPTKIADQAQQHKPMQANSEIAQKTLPAFLKEKGATKNQIKKFLATAVLLEAKGQSRVSTRDVTSALKASNQSRLANSSDCLNKNVTKGYCEKDGKQFFVTQDGKDSL
jgi:hypothetical protein